MKQELDPFRQCTGEGVCKIDRFWICIDRLCLCFPADTGQRFKSHSLIK